MLNSLRRLKRSVLRRFFSPVLDVSGDCPSAANDLPPELDPCFYASIYPDLDHLSKAERLAHFQRCGEAEGRQGNALRDRGAFANLVTRQLSALEIGPFAQPLLRGERVRYADYLASDALRDRARLLGLDPAGVPPIHHILSATPLGAIDCAYDAVLSSHCIEHQPDLIRHLLDVEHLLAERSGRYFLLVPDKRYCFDHYLPESSIADIITAHVERRTVHTLKSVIEHRALTTHNDPALHWQFPDNARGEVSAASVRAAIDEWVAAKGEYIDVHAWYFTPASFRENIRLLKALGYIHFELERLYATRKGSNEFWAVLSYPCDEISKLT